MSNWKVTGADFDSASRAVFTVTRGSKRLDHREQDELEALLAGWISVDDELPEIGVDVLVYRPRAKESHDALVRVSRRGWESKANQSPQGVLHCFECWCHPTHWMPITPPTN